MATVTRKTILINNTAASGTFYKQLLGPSEAFEIPNSELALFRDDPTTSGCVVDGTLLVSDGENTFGAGDSDAVQWFFDNPRPLRPTTINLEDETLVTLASGVDGVGGIGYTVGTRAIVGEGGVTVISGTNSVTVSGAEYDFLSGKIYQVSYGYNGTVGNKWMEVGHGNPSNQSPHIVPYHSDIIAVTFSNKNSGVDQDLEVWVAPDGSGSSATLQLVWQLRNVRTGRNTSITPIPVGAGDKIAIYLRDQGTNPGDPICNLYLQVQSAPLEESTENFSGYM